MCCRTIPATGQHGWPSQYVTLQNAYSATNCIAAPRNPLPPSPLLLVQHYLRCLYLNMPTMRYMQQLSNASFIVPDRAPRLPRSFMTPRYMDKGRDTVEQGKFYARLLGLLGKAGLRV